MLTKAQTKANRKNSQNSTGPKTAEGKDAVSQNAVKHGLFAESVIKGENPADYEAFHDKLLAEYSPVGAVEFMLAERFVSLAWRLKRADRMQNQAIDDFIESKITDPSARRDRECYYLNQSIRPGDPRFDLDRLPLGRIATHDWSNCRVLDRMLMYERRIENSMIKIMKELKRCQVIRRLERQDAEPEQSTTEPSSPADRKGDLKKQSQYVQIEIGAKSFMQGDYGNKPACGTEENKANQSQSYVQGQTKKARKRKNSLATAAG